MKQFVNTAQAAGVYTSGGTSYQVTSSSSPVTVTGGSQCVCKTMSIENAACVCDASVSHVATRFFAACGHTILRAEYGVRVRYIDSCGQERTAYEEGDVLFFDLDSDTRVFFLNPPEVESGCGCDIRVCFQVRLESAPETPPVCPCPGPGGQISL